MFRGRYILFFLLVVLAIVYLSANRQNIGKFLRRERIPDITMAYLVVSTGSNCPFPLERLKTPVAGNLPELPLQLQAVTSYEVVPVKGGGSAYFVAGKNKEGNLLLAFFTAPRQVFRPPVVPPHIADIATNIETSCLELRFLFGGIANHVVLVWDQAGWKYYFQPGANRGGQLPNWLTAGYNVQKWQVTIGGIYKVD